MGSVDAEAASVVPGASAPERAARTRRVRSRTLLLFPALLIIGVIGIAPLFIALVYSFLEPGTYGGVSWHFSSDAYLNFLFNKDLFSGALTFDSSYITIFGRSVMLAAYATVASLLVGFPAAYFMATRPPSQRNLWVLLITIPFWSNLLIRTYAIQLLVRDQGVINNILMSLGLIDQPLKILYTNWAVGFGLAYSFLPFMVLPLYASLEKIDFRLVEAAFDLYATRAKVLRRVIIPLARPGIVAGCILVFIPGLGAYLTPELLGGGKKLMIGNLIAIQFGSSRNWPFGCAAALILMALVLIALAAQARNARTAADGAGHG